MERDFGRRMSARFDSGSGFRDGGRFDRPTERSQEQSFDFDFKNFGDVKHSRMRNGSDDDLFSAKLPNVDIDFNERRNVRNSLAKMFESDDGDRLKGRFKEYFREARERRDAFLRKMMERGFGRNRKSDDSQSDDRENEFRRASHSGNDYPSESFAPPRQATSANGRPSVQNRGAGAGSEISRGGTASPGVAADAGVGANSSAAEGRTGIGGVVDFVQRKAEDVVDFVSGALQNTADTAKNLLGKALWVNSPVDVRNGVWGCAASVSEALIAAGDITRDEYNGSVHGVEQLLSTPKGQSTPDGTTYSPQIGKGWVRVDGPVPGAVVCGYRNGRPGYGDGAHIGIVGPSGQTIFNNHSDTGLWSEDPLSAFDSTQYGEVAYYVPPDSLKSNAS